MTRKHGTASQVTGSVNLDELQRETERLLALLKDRQPGMMSWRQFMDERLRTLHALIGIAITSDAGDIYPLSVDYRRSVEDAVKAGRYDLANSDITSKNFPTNRKGTTEVAVELVHFNRFVSTNAALRKLDRMGFRPAELHELLAFGKKYPEIQHEFPIVALGSVWQERVSNLVVPCLEGNGWTRGLDLRWIGGDWDVIYRFAAVRK